MKTLAVEGWETRQRILVILAHPDDPEFFCGATIARWVDAGHSVRYCLLTCGDKGSSDPLMDPRELARLREGEQRAAAAVLGVESVRFLNYPDGELIPTLEARREVVRVVRQEKPDILVTCDPTNYFPDDTRINHPDHRAAGQIVVDAFFPGVGNPMYFPALIQDGLPPHTVKELWLSGTIQPNTTLDVTPFWPVKLAALHEHRSQIGEVAAFDERMLSRRAPDSTPEAPRFEEKLRRFKFA